MSLFVGCEQNGSGWRRSFDGTVKSNSKWYTPLRTPTGAKLVSRRNVLRMPYSAALVADLRDPCAVSTVALQAQERLA
jgi:hypothetical protein